MKKQLIVLSIAAMTSSVAFAVVGGAPVANQFSAGQPARAADVNENFQELANRIDANNSDVVDNFADIATNATDIASINAGLPGTKQIEVNENLLTRKFVNIKANPSGTCDIRNDSYVFDSGAKTFAQTITYENSSDEVDCSVYDFTWDYNSNLVADNQAITVLNGAVVDYNYSYSPGILLMKEKMRVGEAWASFSDTQYPGYSRHDKVTFLGYQDVTVAAGAFSNCVMMEQKVIMFGNSHHYLHFFCSGPGLTRMIDFVDDKDWQLESYTTQ